MGVEGVHLDGRVPVDQAAGVTPRHHFAPDVNDRVQCMAPRSPDDAHAPTSKPQKKTLYLTTQYLTKSIAHRSRVQRST
eukprot:scaffold227554_cov15-Tisochrysis_lutea.AAC.1